MKTRLSTSRSSANPGGHESDASDIKVYVASPETEQIVRQLFEDVVIRLPLVGTFRGAVHLDIQLILAA